MMIRRGPYHRSTVRTALESIRVRTVRFWAVVGTALIGAALPSHSAAQTVRLGVLMDAARAQLEREWTEDPRQVERAYCVTGWWATVRHGPAANAPQDDSIFRVTRLEHAEMNAATPESAEFECAAGVPELHVHPPTTCPGDDPANCVVGGLNAYSCQPSREDLVKLTRRGDPFAIVQCDKRSVRFYYPAEFGVRGGTVFANTARSGAHHPSGNLTPAMTAALPTLPPSDAAAATVSVGGNNSAAP